jgi:hypothetical protein
MNVDAALVAVDFHHLGLPEKVLGPSLLEQNI